MRPRSALIITTVLTALLAAAAGCQSGGSATPPAAAVTADSLDAASTVPINASTAVMVVHGLGCPLCAHNLDEQLAAIGGVRDVQVNLGTGEITVGLEGDKRPSPAQLAAAVDRSGFTLVRIYTP